MSADRTDHAAESRRIVADGEAAVGKLREAHDSGNYLIADEYGKKAIGCWAQAQVHATLALVEQQRVANLIHLADGARAEYNATYEQSTGEFFLDLNRQIREGLGLS